MNAPERVCHFGVNFSLQRHSITVNSFPVAYVVVAITLFLQMSLNFTKLPKIMKENKSVLNCNSTITLIV